MANKNHGEEKFRTELRRRNAKTLLTKSTQPKECFSIFNNQPTLFIKKCELIIEHSLFPQFQIPNPQFLLTAHRS
ncbi:hypothetical protein SY85_15000 [Flavisolibacter tropicus]|uniref:Uncharacterized protein n=1 Tax=Flavisolibacter tropicus TaxID=1492898 RepID=A0A172TXL2_9BACT|nr:hypothetical protein SY85_15000 [Flavisolibacter tropicus]